VRRALRALLVEDSADDAALLIRELSRGGFDVEARRVESFDELQQALAAGPWDVVFGDYSMPRFRGTVALEIVRNAGLDVPFIFVSGTMGEDLAVEAMRAGANDYVIKGNLKRLVPAVERELRDIATRRERRAAEDALRAAEERQRQLYAHVADVVLVCDRNGVLQFASPSVRELLGYPPDDLIGRVYLELVHPDDVAAARDAWRRAVGAPGAAITTVVQVRHAGGSWRDIEALSRNLLDHPDVRGMVVTARDVTERRALEAEFYQAQKLETVGRLAGGIAHDFNNLLAVILGDAEWLLTEGHLRDDQRRDVEEIVATGRRAAVLTRQLLAFSRRQVLQLRPLDLNAVMTGMHKLLLRVLGEDIAVVLQLAPDLATVRGDAGQLEQVLLNLAVNARDAMPEGGRLTIATANVDLGEETGAELPPGVGPGRFVALTVTDTGLGMDAATKERIFEPFFTTKPGGKGTGLGLATVYGIARQSGGFVRAESQLGHGTTFRVYLPGVDGPPDPLDLTTAGPTPMVGTETLLVVEDDDHVRAITCRVLRAQGYVVIEAARAEAALPILADQGRTLDLLLTDAVLPGLGGKELVERARQLRPGLPAIYISGYASDALAQRGVMDPGITLVEKPFTAVELGRKVREVLRRS